MAYEHLRLEREAPSTERHPRRHPGIRPPADPRAHGAALAGRLDQARQRAMAEDVGGFDDLVAADRSGRLQELLGGGA